MTTLQQAIHIFKKDARHLRLEIAGIFVLLLVLILSGVQTWDNLQEHGWPGGGDSPLTVFLPVAWALLIARAIQTEALPGDRHFWLTRPYSRASLVLSKTLLIIAFVLAPFMFAQAIIVAWDGLPVLSNLPGLLWNQVLIALLFLLPVAAVAALTRNLAQFLPAVILLMGLLAIPMGEAVSSNRPDFDWIRNSLGILAAGVVAGFVVWRQYRLRRAGNTAIFGVGALLASLILYLSFPQSAAFAVQSRLIGSRDERFGMKLGEPTRVKGKVVGSNRYRQLIELPVTVQGADAGSLRIDSYTFVVKTLSGATRRMSGRLQVGKDGIAYRASVDRSFFDTAKDSPVSVKAEYYLAQFGNAGSDQIPLDGTPVYRSDIGQCGAVVNYDRRIFVCRSAFRAPGQFSSERIAGREHCDPCWSGYSPFPAQISIYPIMTDTYRLLSNGGNDLAPAAPEAPATVVGRKPVAYFRYTMEANNVRLADYAIPEPAEESAQ